MPPQKVATELTKIQQVSCSSTHTEEAYAVVGYKAPDGSVPDDYPGDSVLKQYANGVCAQRFAGYVGVDYQDSSLFFTYLLPSARSWSQADDHNVDCFITTTGSVLHASVKGTGK